MKEERGGSSKKKAGGGPEDAVCDSINDSIIHKVQFNVNCQIIS